jgi:hypothetical protein
LAPTIRARYRVIRAVLCVSECFFVLFRLEIPFIVPLIIEAKVLRHVLHSPERTV